MEQSQSTIHLDYPVVPRPRWGHGRPRHPELFDLLDAHSDRYAELLSTVPGQYSRLRNIAVHGDPDPTAPTWINGFMPGMDTAVLYTIVASGDVGTYLEMGSGNSTKIVRRAIEDNGKPTRVVSIDPQPRAEIDQLCDVVLRTPAEDVDPSVVSQLTSGDVLFIDNSHRSFMNSDVTMAFLELLPRIPSGVLVHIHDVFLPDDYPPQWEDRWYNEQYLLATFLLGGHRGYEILFPAWFVSTQPTMGGALNELWETTGFEDVERHGNSFWLRRT